MPRKPAPRPDDPPEWVAAAIRFTFGAVFGLIVGAGGFLFIPSHFWYLTVGVMVVLTIVCGFLAARYGDGFWESLSSWFRWW